MALARTDEIDLLTALYDGVHEEPRWRTFLARMLRRTRADHVSLIVGQGETPIFRATQWFAGRDMQTQAQQLAELAALDPIPYQRLRPGRVYTASEMIDPADARQARFRREYLERIGVRSGRYMRVTEPAGRSAWLAVSRAAGDFAAADGALLSALAPHLSIALRTLGELERARFRAAVADDALAHAGIGWHMLGRDAHVIDSGGAAPRPAGARLATGGAEADRALAALADAMARDAALPPRALRVEGERPLDLLAVPVPDRPHAATALPAMVALTRTVTPPGPALVDALVRLFALTPSEARLAACLAAGQSLGEAAATLKLSIETVRNYSKRLFAKTATRGQADLVRLVLTSVAALA